MKIKKILISLLFAVLLVFACGRVHGTEKTQALKFTEIYVTIAGFAYKDGIEHQAIRLNCILELSNPVSNTEKNMYKVKYWYGENNEEEGGFNVNSGDSKYISGHSKIIYLKRNQKLTYVLYGNGNIIESSGYISRPPEITGVQFYEGSSGMQIKVKTYNEDRYNLESIYISDATSEYKGINGDFEYKNNDWKYEIDDKYKVWTIDCKQELYEGSAYRISATNNCGTTMFKPIKLTYYPPKIKNVKQEGKNIIFNVEKTEYDIKEVKVYRADENWKITDGFKNFSISGRII